MHRKSIRSVTLCSSLPYSYEADKKNTVAGEPTMLDCRHDSLEEGVLCLPVSTEIVACVCAPVSRFSTG